ncbi:MAG: hypothetical protein ACKVTZ_01990, partial [Bacteroidia bacterium]
MKTSFSIAFYCFMLWLKVIAVSFVLSLLYCILTWGAWGGFSLILFIPIGIGFISFFPLLTFRMLAGSYFHYYPYQNKIQLKEQLHLLGAVNCIVFNLIFGSVLLVDKT